MLNKHASRGQVLILLAAAAVALIGMLGLAIDLGFDMAQRRTMQNAADAGAMAGAHAIARSNPASPISVLSTVTTVAKSNSIGGNKPTVTSCVYVDNTDQVLGNCSMVVPATASGVKVSVKESHSTMFIRAIPGGPQTASTSASATAHVEVLKLPPSDGPFLVCGVGTKSDSGPKNVPILIQDSVTKAWSVNPAAVSKSTTDASAPNYQIYGPQVAQCGLPNSSYKGLALGTNNKNLTIPGYFYYTNGDNAGGLAADVVGAQGCTTTQIVNCVAFLPVAVIDTSHPVDASNHKLWTAMILPFFINGTPTGNGNYNNLNGRVMGDYITQGDGNPTWTPGNNNPIVVRLTK